MPDREHDTTCARTRGLIAALNRLADTLDIPTLTDLGYQNTGAGLRHPVKKPKAANSLTTPRRSTPPSEASTVRPNAPTP